MNQLILLGTGNAMVTHCYNTCFVLGTDDNYFLVDAGGGNTILKQLLEADIPISSIHHAFISHNHSDHILGFPWIIRAICTAILKGSYEGNFTLYGHAYSIEAIRTICRYVLQPKFLKLFDSRILFDVIEHNSVRHLLGHTLTFFDINSTKEQQFGFHATLNTHQTLCFLGDEPYRDTLAPYVQSVDYLLHEAFCLYSERHLFKPYEKHHATVKDAALNAQKLCVKNLILYHTEDKNISTRKELYTKEGAAFYNGNLFVPNDLERITIS